MTEETLNRLQDVNPSAVYEHSKTGNLYSILTVAKNVNRTGQYMMVYKSQKTGEVWVRPVEEFFENVEVDGFIVPRFRPVRSQG